MNYYEELGIRSDADEEEIRKAHRRLVKLMHPDQHRDAGLKALAETQMRRLNSIVATLLDPEEREEYDEQLRGGGSNGTDPSNHAPQQSSWRSVPWWIASTLGAIVLTVAAVWFFADRLGSSFSPRNNPPKVDVSQENPPAPPPISEEKDKPTVVTVPPLAKQEEPKPAEVQKLPEVKPPEVKVEEKKPIPPPTPPAPVVVKETPRVERKAPPQVIAATPKPPKVEQKPAQQPIKIAKVLPPPVARPLPKPIQTPPPVVIARQPAPVVVQPPVVVNNTPPPPQPQAPPKKEPTLEAVVTPPPTPTPTPAVPIDIPKPERREPAPAAPPPASTPTYSKNHDPLEGEWVYAPNEPEKRKPGLYPPEFIQLKLVKDNSGMHGEYSARYNVDRSVSPDVNFVLKATDPTAMKYVWTASNGAHGWFVIRNLETDTMRLEWRDTSKRNGQMATLTSGIATLVRKN